MAIDLRKDARRQWLVLIGLGTALCVCLGWIGVREGRQPWRRLQGQFAELGLVARSRSLGIHQERDCQGEWNRCTTCHLGIDRRDLAGNALPKVFAPHPDRGWKHPLQGMGCVACHGGTARSLDPGIAHRRPGSAEKDPLLGQPHIQASCSRCHLPGDRPGMERLVAGAMLYLNLGCGMCHPLENQGRGGFDFGPDLRQSSRRSLPFLKNSLLEPTTDFPGSTMPSFQRTFASDTEGLTALLIFVESLSLPRAERCSLRPQGDPWAEVSCLRCHGKARGAASGLLGHRCLYLLERRAELSCAGCHPGELAAAANARGDCPIIAQHRKNCAVCHERETARR